MKTVLISGASRGIGRALAEKFLQEGFEVIGTSRTGKAVFAHEHLTFVSLELGKSESIDACADAITRMGKKIDIFINNAGIWDERDNTLEVSSDILRDTLEMNLVGPIHLCERIVSLVIKGGQVINMSSRRGSCERTIDATYPCYGISKAGLNLYTRQLAARLMGKITVSAVHPGSVHTDLNPDGEMTPQEAAGHIFTLSQTEIETGQFWYKGEKFPW